MTPSPGNGDSTGGAAIDTQTAQVPRTEAGSRLDTVAAKLFSEYSRTRLQSWITAGFLRVDNETRRTRDRLLGGETLSLALPADAVMESWEDALARGADALKPEAMPISIVYEDDDLLVVDKSAGRVMHPAPGNRTGTLMQGLLHRYPDLITVPRAGIVHRLDKDTTGLCVVARNLVAHTHLVRQLQSRSMGREYRALVFGSPLLSGTVDAAIARHPRDRQRMAVVPGGKPAVTHFEVVSRLSGVSLLAVKLETGRTHQIRVHMTHLGFPLVGDPVYGKRLAQRLQGQTSQPDLLAAFARQALHARRLTLRHPATDIEQSFDAAIPDDMAELLENLRTRVDE